MSINYDELNKSRKFAENLVNNVYSPKTNWEKTAKNLLIIEIMIEDLRERKIMSCNEELKIRKILAKISYSNILDSPEFENEEEKKRIKISLINDLFNLYGLSKDIRVFDY